MWRFLKIVVPVRMLVALATDCRFLLSRGRVVGDFGEHVKFQADGFILGVFLGRFYGPLVSGSRV